MRPSAVPLVRFDAVRKVYGTGSRSHVAVDGVSFDVREGECFGLVGESGSGKSTTANLLLGLEPITAGRIVFDGRDIAHLTGRERRTLAGALQMVFQDPFASLNPRKTVEQIVGLPLRAQGVGGAAERRRRVVAMLDRVGLAPGEQMLPRYPHAFSGGQRQRIAIARALVSQPRFVVADEPVSALDVSIRSQVLNTLSDLRREYALTLLLISHDLSTIRTACDRIGVLYLGRLVEVTDRDRVARPEHPYTELLLSALLLPEPGARLHPLAQTDRGEDPAGGCPFWRRCPHGTARCRAEMPELREVGSVAVACHHPRSERAPAGMPAGQELP